MKGSPAYVGLACLPLGSQPRNNGHGARLDDQSPLGLSKICVSRDLADPMDGLKLRPLDFPLLRKASVRLACGPFTREKSAGVSRDFTDPGDLLCCFFVVTTQASEAAE